jgi:CDP-glycerol glycerophosphotransferase (TagB/SpsB family)
VPHFDLHYDAKQNPIYGEYLKELGLNPDKPYIFFGMSSPVFAPHEVDIVEWIARQIEEGTMGDDIQLVVRPHPQNVTGNMADKSWLPRLETIESSRVGVDYPKLVNSNVRWSMKQNDMLRLSHLLAGSSVTLNSGSTLSIDAMMVDKPVILTSFDAEYDIPYWKSARRLIDFPHLKKFISFKGVSIVKDFEQLKAAILVYIMNPQLNWEARAKTINMECFAQDGKATERVVNHLTELAKFDNKI